ncbi:MAG: hypothetical protein R3A80_05205 [Bdellovibrionota bacterium]
MKKIPILLTLIFSIFAQADQCAWNEYSISAAAREIIKNMAEVNNQKPSIYTYCEPCGEKEMNRVYLVEKGNVEGNQNPYDVTVNRMTTPIPADAATGDNKPSIRSGLWQLTVHHNREFGSYSRFDLAYTYVKIAANRYANLAYVVGCPAEGVTPVIKTDGDTIKEEGVDEEGKAETDDGIFIRDYTKNALRAEG